MASTPEADDDRGDSKRHEQEGEAHAEQEHSPKPLDHPFSIIRHQAWRIDGGEIEFVIRTSEPLPPSTYTLVAEMAQVAARMKDLLTGPMVELTTDSPPAAYRADPAPEPSHA